MRRLLIVLAMFGMVAMVAPGGAAAEEPLAYGVFRVVKAAAADTVAAPEISVPEGYGLVAGSQYQVASRAEYYSFVSGPSAASIPVTVTWPEARIKAVIVGDTRLPLTRVRGGVQFEIPVTGTSASSLQSTLQVWSYPSPSTASGIHFRVEHNDPDRVAGPWTTVPFPTTETKAFLNLLFACDAVLKDSGLAAEAQRRGHFFSLMGFETNNTLHADNPPHWHLAYYPGLDYSAPRAHVPHFWLDKAGKTFYNGMDIQGEGRSKFYAGDPAPIEDVEGNLIVTLTIRTDGGLDIDPPNGPHYEITAPDGDFTSATHILRDGVPWHWFAGTDDVERGRMVIREGNFTPPVYRTTTVYRYDPLTGAFEN